MANLMYLLIVCIAFAVLFMVGCGIEWLWFSWHERHTRRPSMRDWK